MKTPILILTLITTLLLPSCSTLQKNPTLTAITEQAVLPLLVQQLPADEQVEVKRYASSLATAIRTINPANPPTAAEFNQLLSKWIPAKYRSFSLIVSTIYVNEVQPKLTSSVKLNAAQLESLASALDALSL